MRAAFLGLAICLVLLAGCTGGYQSSSYAISRNDKPIKTTTKLVPTKGGKEYN
ncbi:MAG: hypothetical protein P0S95_06065 [Rhabdochlamydiaceae bacterium]|nr:hypothetical protein [Candidatus Amphrikana amoebophyrae]